MWFLKLPGIDPEYRTLIFSGVTGIYIAVCTITL